MHLLLASLSSAIAAPVLVIDDTDADTLTFQGSLGSEFGHAVTLSSDFGVVEWEFEGDTTAPTGEVLRLEDYDVIVWFDGGPAAGASMPVSGQAALLEYVNNGGSLMLFGQNGYNFNTGRHGDMAPMIPLRSWTNHEGGSIICDDEEHPICEAFGTDEVTISGGHLSTSILAADTYATRLFGYKPWWVPEFVFTRMGAAHLNYGLGRALQWGLWGNSGSAALQSPWWDSDIMEIMNLSVEWLTQDRPPVADAGGPYTATAGDLVALSASDSRARGSAELEAFRWDIGSVDVVETGDPIVDFDSSILDGPITVTVNLQVEDSEGRTDNTSTTLTVANADPVFEEIDCPDSLDEAEVGSFSAGVVDPEVADITEVEWLLDGELLGAGEEIAVSFADNGSVDIGVAVSDDDGGRTEASCPAPISIENVPPLIVGSPPTDVDALSAYRFRPDVEDPGTFDVHAWSLEGPDAATVDPATGTVEWTPTLDDVGEYDLILRVNDGDDNDTFSWTVTVRWPDLDADGYRYDDDCNDEDATVYPGASELCDDVDSDCDGDLTDDYDDIDGDDLPDCIDDDADGDGVALTEDCNDRDDTVYPGADESCDFTDSDCDGSLVDEFDDSDADGEPDCIDSDLDGDGLADAWEEAYGLDPDDAADGGSDEDGDGRTALDEFMSGSDPTVYDGPGAPTVYAPIDGGEINELPAVITVIDGDAPLGQDLTHTFTIGLLETLEMPLEVIAEVPGEDDGTTSAAIEAELVENSWVYWTARAHDDFTSGPTMTVAMFFVNLVNEPPDTPGVVGPLDGSTSVGVTLEALTPTDPDLDEVSLVFSIELPDGALLVSEARSSETDTVAWTPPITADDGATLCWTATPVDEHGLEGPSTDPACFTIDLTNLPPSAPEFDSPVGTEAVASLTPTIRVINGVDPEDRETQHRFEIDTSDSFSSDALQTAIIDSDASGLTSWSPEEPFEEDTIVFVRVQCTDGASNSDWISTQFLVSETNDPPSIPTLLDPADGVSMGDEMTLVATNSTDPEGGTVVQEFQVLDLRDTVILESGTVEQGEDTTIWAPGLMDEGYYQWTARAVDESGMASDWATARSFVVGTPDQVEEPELGGMVSDGKSSGCSCTSAAAHPRSTLLWIASLFGLVLQRRKRPRS